MSVAEQIVNNIRRYSLTTPEALQRAFLPQMSIADVVEMLNSFVTDGLLASPRPLIGNTVYYTTQDFASTASRNAVFKAFAILSFCYLQDSCGRLLLPDEFRASFPELVRPGLPMNNYYISFQNEDESNHLGYFYIDLGRDKRRVFRKCYELAERRYSLPAFKDVVEQGRFRITLLTGNLETVNYVEGKLQTRTSACSVSVVYIPELQFVRP